MAASSTATANDVTVAPSPNDAIPGMMLVNGETHTPSQQDIELWVKAYPKVNVVAELWQMCAWCYENPKRRKTAKGINRFIGSWLRRANEGGRYRTTCKPSAFDSDKQYTEMGNAKWAAR